MEVRHWVIVCITADGKQKILPGRWTVWSDANEAGRFLRRNLPGCSFQLIEDFHHETTAQ